MSGLFLIMFLQMVRLCRQTGLVRLGHVALDGTKMRANASKHKAMSYGRMDGKIAELEQQIRQLMAEAEAGYQAECNSPVQHRKEPDAEFQDAHWTDGYIAVDRQKHGKEPN